jgi:hypothetical protein
MIITVYKFLMIVDRNRNAHNAQKIATRACALIVFFITFFLLGTGYMYLISVSLVTFRRGIAFIFFMSFFVGIYAVIMKKYSVPFTPNEIASYDARFSFKKWRTAVVAMLLFFGPLSLVWGDLLVVRAILYKH